MEAARIEIGSIYMRSVYSRMLAAIPEMEGQGFIVSEKTLILEQVLQSGVNSYSFNLYENNNERPLERKLNRNDGFVISHLGLSIRKQDTTLTPPQYGSFPEFTHPDPNYFVGAVGGINENECLENLYSGALSLTTNNTEIIQEFPTYLLRYVPERGYTKFAAPQTRDEWPQYGPTMEERGLYPYAVNCILSGQDNNTVKVLVGAGNTSVIAGGVTAAGAALTTTNVLVVKLHGFEIAEASQAGLRWGTF